MGNERQYIRNLALSLMGELRVDQEIFSRWETFPPPIRPAQAMNSHCGLLLHRKMWKMTPTTLGRIASFGRRDLRPEFEPVGTTLHDVLGEDALSTCHWGGTLLHMIAHATIIAEMVDILFEQLTPEQRERFRSKSDDRIPTGRQPGRSVNLVF